MKNDLTESEVPRNRKVFISYSWSDDDYVLRVRELAEELADNGIEVELDQWSLREGDDTFHYMELMVNDNSIDKVLILLDRKYKEKADGRAGGVGTEATIMTPKVYSDVVARRGKQKFIPVMMERDESGSTFVPAFLDGRKYVDLTDSGHYAERFEELVRAIYDRPLHKKPVPGNVPSYLLANETTTLGTAGRARRAIEFIKNEKVQALTAIKEYFADLLEKLRAFDFPTSHDQVRDEEVIERIRELVPVRDELIDVFVAIAKFKDDAAYFEEVRTFFENLLVFFERYEGTSNHPWAPDHYKFLAHELFLYFVAASLKFQRFSQLNEITEQGYYFAGTPYSRQRNVLLSYLTFNRFSDALSNFNRRQDRQYYSFEAHLLNQRATRTDIRFEDLMQADFFLYLLYHLDEELKRSSVAYSRWYPSTLGFAEYRDSAFEVFARSQSKRFFDRFRIAIRNTSKENLTELAEKLKNDDENRLRRRRIDLELFAGLSLIETSP